LRILQSVIYLVFVDLLQIYQSYYLLISVMLEKFDEMTLKDAKRAFIIYLNFMKINKEIRKMASSIIQEFNIKIDISFYEIDTKVIEALKISIESKEKERLVSKGGHL
jgi:predicted RNA-binding protein Jag